MRLFASSALAALCLFMRPAIAAPEGTLTIGLHVSAAPTWFDPAEAPGYITPYMFYYLMHDAMGKAMPGADPAPALAESWTSAPDGMSHDFVLRAGTKFHDNTPVTVEDVRFSFQRYRGVAHTTLHDRVAAVEIVNDRTVRFHMKAPWPDFMTYYLGVTSAGWVVPKAYVEKTGEDGFKKAPIGAGPYKYVTFKPGIELVAEASETYWRKVPAIKRIVYKVIPDEAVRLVALKRGEVDIAFSIRGELARAIEQTPGLSLQPTQGAATFWIYFANQFDPKSPWHDQRVREAARYAIDYDTINKTLLLGHGKMHGSLIPDMFDYYSPVPAPKYDPAKARALLAEAGYPNGLDAGNYHCDSSYSNLAEIVVNNLAEAGIRTKLQPVERVAFAKAYAEKKLKDIIQGGSAAIGNTATRFEVFAVKDGAYTYGSYPDIDEMFHRQAMELDRAKRGAILIDMQRRLHERAMYAPLWQLALLNGVGPRVGVSGLNLIKGFLYTAPYEDITLKAK